MTVRQEAKAIWGNEYEKYPAGVDENQAAHCTTAAQELTSLTL